MLFNSLHFLIFLPVVVALYYLLPFRFRWILIFCSELLFLHGLVPKYILILFFIIIIDYGSALAIERSQTKSRRRFFLVASLVPTFCCCAFLIF